MSGGGKWGDLKTRIVSALALLAVAALAVWLGGVWFVGFLALAAGAIIWECGRLGGAEAGPLRDVALPVIGAASFVGGVWIGAPTAFIAFSVASVAVYALSQRLQSWLLFYSLFALIAVLALYGIRAAFGVPMLVFVVFAVIASDVMGYFAGRFLGGPKFWPAVSPKKTWSGTVAGWLGAALMGVLFAPYLHEGPLPFWLFGVLLAFAAQMGDITESALKRKAGVKDSSDLIPGHGGVLDRVDGLIGAALVFFVIWVIL